MDNQNFEHNWKGDMGHLHCRLQEMFFLYVTWFEPDYEPTNQIEYKSTTKLPDTGDAFVESET